MVDKICLFVGRTCASKHPVEQLFAIFASLEIETVSPLEALTGGRVVGAREGEKITRAFTSRPGRFGAQLWDRGEHLAENQVNCMWGADRRATGIQYQQMERKQKPREYCRRIKSFADGEGNRSADISSSHRRMTRSGNMVLQEQLRRWRPLD
jgi:hypothetical protein